MWAVASFQFRNAAFFTRSRLPGTRCEAVGLHTAKRVQRKIIIYGHYSSLYSSPRMRGESIGAMAGPGATCVENPDLWILFRNRMSLHRPLKVGPGHGVKGRNSTFPPRSPRLDKCDEGRLYCPILQYSTTPLLHQNNRGSLRWSKG